MTREEANRIIRVCMNDWPADSKLAVAFATRFAREDALEAENVRLREALEPFDDALGEDSDDDQSNDLPVTMKYGRTTNYALKLGDLRRARAALGDTQ